MLIEALGLHGPWLLGERAIAYETDIFEPFPRTSRAYVLGVVLVLLAGTCWSSGGVLFRLVEDAEVWQVVFYRSFTLAVAMVFVIPAFNRGRFFSVLWEAGFGGAVCGFCIATASFSFLIALNYTTVANAVFMLAAMPFFGAFLGWWILSERVRANTWIAMAIACVGLFVMVFSSFQAGGLVGSILAMYAAFAAACFTVLLRWGQDIDMMPAIFNAGLFGMLFGGVLILFPSPWSDQYGPQMFLISWSDFMYCAAMGFGQLALGLVLFTIGSRTIPAAELTLLSLSEPLLAPVWVWLVVGEVPAILTLIGGAVLMLALIYQALSGARRKRIPAPLR